MKNITTTTPNAPVDQGRSNGPHVRYLILTLTAGWIIAVIVAVLFMALIKPAG